MSQAVGSHSSIKSLRLKIVKRYAPIVCAGFVSSYALSLFLIWVLFPEHKEFSSVSMKANATVGFLGAGFALALLKIKTQSNFGSFLKTLTVGLLSYLVWLIGIATLTQYVMGWDLGIDQFITSDFMNAESSRFPGRMSPLAAFCFILLGGALFIRGTKSESHRVDVPFILTLPILFICVVALLGYFYGTPSLYQVGSYIRISWESALCFVILGAGILFVRPNTGPLGMFTGHTSGGHILRGMLPAIIFFPIVFGRVKLFLQDEGYLSVGGATALLIIVLGIVFLGLILRLVHLLDVTDRKRLEALSTAEDNLRSLEESQMQLNIALEGAQLGTWSMNISSGEMEFSPRTRELFGILPHSSLDDLEKSIDHYVHPDDRSRVRTTLGRAASTFSMYADEYRVITHDGKTRWLYMKGQPKKSGAHTVFSGISMDVTEMKRTQKELRESYEHFRLLSEALPLIVWTTEANGRITYFNKKWYEYTGLNEGLAWDPGVLLHPEDISKVFQDWKHALASATEFTFEYRLRRHDGEYRWHMGAVLPLKDLEGKVLKWAGVGVDIHDQKIYQQELSTALRSRDEFLSIASHELKTPLTSLRLQTQAMHYKLKKNDPATWVPEQMIKMLEGNEKQVVRLVRLVDDMMDVTSIKAGKLTVQKEPGDYAEVAREVVERLSQQLLAAGCSVEINCRDTCPGVFDRYRIEQVFINLLTNVIRYSPQQPVTMRLEHIDHTIRISVQDRGIGIAQEDHQRIFKRFERASGSKTVGGLGLGLYITRQIIESHEGKIWVESNVGQGATFYIELPAAEFKATRDTLTKVNYI